MSGKIKPQPTSYRSRKLRLEHFPGEMFLQYPRGLSPVVQGLQVRHQQFPRGRRAARTRVLLLNSQLAIELQKTTYLQLALTRVQRPVPTPSNVTSIRPLGAQAGRART